MKRSILTLAASAALLAGGATGAQAATTCYSINIPAVPAVYETVTTPAVTVTEYEFTHAQDGNGNSNGQGPANRWMEDPAWNAESNPASVGWVATGNTRLRVIETERTTVTLVTPEVPASVQEECLELPDGVPDQRPVEEIPGATVPAPAVVEEPAVAAVQPVAVEAAPAPLAAVGAPTPAIQPVAATAPEAPPEELAYTGAADWVLPAGLGLVILGAASIASRRFFATN